MRNNAYFRYVRVLQKGIVFLLLATFNTIFFIIKNIVQKPLTQLTANNLMEPFSIFLVILIGIELLETVKAFLMKELIQMEIVVLVAIIVVARKVIIWDFTESCATEVFGLSVILLTLGITYFQIRQTSIKIDLGAKKMLFKKSKMGKIVESEKG